MIVCGIHDGHNASVALVKDGELIGALQEERCTRVKNAQGFPGAALKVLLSRLGVEPEEIDAYAFAGLESYTPLSADASDKRAQMQCYKKNGTVPGDMRRALRHTPARALIHAGRRRARVGHLVAMGVSRQNIHFTEHHQCHASTAFYGKRPHDGCVVFTADGAGDALSATVSVANRGSSLRRIATTPEDSSIGILWALTTALLGMVPLEHEYKLMGMAPYAKGAATRTVADRLWKCFRLEGGAWTRSGSIPELHYSYPYVKDLLEFARFDHICGGLQLFTEELFSKWIEYWLRETGRNRVRLSGGLFMNVKLNQRIGELHEVEDLFVFPSCGDETNSIGAAWAYLGSVGEADSIHPIEDLYLGPPYRADEVRQALEAAHSAGCRISTPPDVNDEVASLLAAGEIVARFDGRQEFGARALGNRSILADPQQPGVVKTINDAIKCRDFWMPFACSIIPETSQRYLHNPKGYAAPYMILTFNSLNTQEIAGGCHPEDGTVRPQVVYPEWNISYYQVISRFLERTGRGGILNTSFNIHGEPIVSTPMEAVDVLLRSGLRNLALDKHMIAK